MKNYYTYAFLLLFIIFVKSSSFAQQESKRERIDELRAAFITKRVNFTLKEAQLFWPLYNEMNDKLTSVRRTFRQKYNAQTNYNFATDAEADEYLTAELFQKQKEYEIYKEYYDKFKKILPVKEVAAVRRAEEDFRKEIIKSIKDN